jgi:acetyl-CoA acyltransferase
MKERIAVIDGVRSPFCKAGGVLRNLEADDLGAIVVKELLLRTGFPADQVDELIFGNVMQPPHAGNIARVVSVKAGMPVQVPAYTVNRNCASGMEAITSAMNRLWQEEADVIIAGGTESMSNFPVLFGKRMRDFLTRFSKAKSWKQKLSTLLGFRPSFFKPEIPEIADPLCSLSMGQTAEILSRDFRITRQEQDQFSYNSQQRAAKAIEQGLLAQEIMAVPVPPQYQQFQLQDEGPRASTSLEALAALKPAFDKATGSVTAGNSSQMTDGAAALLLMRESTAKKLGLKPIGYLTEYAVAGLDPRRMGLGPVFATSKLLKKTGLALSDFDLVEINEAFAAQVLACLKAFNSLEFAQKHLGREAPIGELSLDKLNVNGGAVALGHPLGASGARLVLTLLKELKRRGKKRGLATLCVGGGQGQALSLESE